MRQDLELRAKPAGRIFVKLTIFGCFLLGLAYISLLLLNNVLSALH